MYAVIRTYSGPGATQLFDRIVAAREEVQSLIEGVQGFLSYTLIRTDDGGVTITVCQNKAGTDESLKVARDWVAAHASDVGAAAPVVSEGPIDIKFP
jgi:hypothetical protein